VDPKGDVETGKLMGIGPENSEPIWWKGGSGGPGMGVDGGRRDRAIRNPRPAFGGRRAGGPLGCQILVDFDWRESVATAEVDAEH
jgi:hypothetical protein